MLANACFFWLFRQLSVWRRVPWTEALTIERLVMSGCGQGHEPAKNFEDDDGTESRLDSCD